MTVVAEDDVVAGTRVDRVAIGAAKNNVAAEAGGDEIAAADRRVERRDSRQYAAGVEQLPAVADDDVVAAARVDVVAGSAAEHHV